MSASHILYAVVLYIIASNLTDWFFFGILFHNKYSVHPEVWRRTQGSGGEGIILSVGGGTSPGMPRENILAMLEALQEFNEKRAANVVSSAR